jgi:hypothetical protein
MNSSAPMSISSPLTRPWPSISAVPTWASVLPRSIDSELGFWWKSPPEAWMKLGFVGTFPWALFAVIVPGVAPPPGLVTV